LQVTFFSFITFGRIQVLTRVVIPDKGF